MNEDKCLDCGNKSNCPFVKIINKHGVDICLEIAEIEKTKYDKSETIFTHAHTCKHYNPDETKSEWAVKVEIGECPHFKKA